MNEFATKVILLEEDFIKELQKFIDHVTNPIINVLDSGEYITLVFSCLAIFKDISSRFVAQIRSKNIGISIAILETSKLLVAYEVYIQSYQKAILSLERASNESEDVRNIIDNANNNPIFKSGCDLSLPARHILQYPRILKDIIKVASTSEKEILSEALHRFSGVCELITRSTSQTPEENYQHLAKMQSKWLSDLTFAPNSLDIYKIEKPLNFHLKWRNQARNPYQVSLDLSTTIFSIYKSFSFAVKKFGSRAFTLIALSQKFEYFLSAVCELQKVNLYSLSEEEKFPFWVNVYHTLLLHAYLTFKHPESLVQRFNFFKKSSYQIGKTQWSLLDIEHCIIRAGLSKPKELGKKDYIKIIPVGAIFVPKIKSNDPRYPLVIKNGDFLFNFAINSGTVGSPRLQVYTKENWKEQLEENAREYLQRTITVNKISASDRYLTFPKVIEWYKKDFGSTDRDVLSLLLSRNLIEEPLASTLSSLVNGKLPLSIRFAEYDWKFCYPI